MAAGCHDISNDLLPWPTREVASNGHLTVLIWVRQTFCVRQHFRKDALTVAMRHRRVKANLSLGSMSAPNVAAWLGSTRSEWPLSALCVDCSARPKGDIRRNYGRCCAAFELLTFMHRAAFRRPKRRSVGQRIIRLDAVAALIVMKPHFTVSEQQFPTCTLSHFHSYRSLQMLVQSTTSCGVP